LKIKQNNKFLVVLNKSSTEGLILPFYANNWSAKNESEGRTFGSKILINVLFDRKGKWRSRFKQLFHIEEQLPNERKEMELNQFLKLINHWRISIILDVSNKSSTDSVILPFYVNNWSAKNESEGRTFLIKTYNKISSNIRKDGKVKMEQ
jgi:hypothetical protein